VSSAVSPARLQALLELDRVWAAYALADLEPEEAPRCEWIVGDEAVILLYRGIDPPVLFARGDPSQFGRLSRQVPPATYTFTLLGVHRAALAERLRPEREQRMWRMVAKTVDFAETSDERARPLGPADLPAIQELFASHPDRPDAFHPRQLLSGPFFGVWDGASLVSVAGTHVFSPSFAVAAVGNVFTRPDCRRQGFAKMASAAVVHELTERGIETIVLNVAMDNTAALHCYRDLGFMPFCGYYEGIGELRAISELGF